MSREPTVAVVLVAAGGGTRLGLGVPKAFVALRGRPMLAYALDGIRGMVSEPQLIVVAPAGRQAEAAELLHGVPNAVVVPGGESRQQSVLAGLAALADAVEVVLVHDAARALTPPAQLDAVVSAVRATGRGVIPGLPVADTIKRVTADEAIRETVDRSELRAVQTPQGFPRAELEAAYAAVASEHTDDAAVYAASGRPVDVIPGDPRAFKITTGDDLRRAELLVGGGVPRTGIGIDVHAFGGDGPLRLALLDWPGERGLAGHSDGDAVAHAVCDALLSAAGLGDIGSRFGTDDPRYAGAAGDVFLRGTVELLAAAGWAPLNVSVQVVGNRPRFAARREEAEAALTKVVGAPVSVSATTTDGLGFTGQGEGIAAIATVLVGHAAGSLS
ncbi:2-C-methyl-D-erythritol 4-phosphate cytidylyltransferase [Naasia aerilata]|uniref:Bifunctional enzyme IspD/IspF n=1 Tax=Naasia aerilata TaxID=1162966 RepID=A0ABM8G9H8_9MICO|nr:2-C-methyl-D-erythritol 4-phosphate cytidylyltransferase [Naasia aerilata]BDZ44847.1 bifunctional enzyme IspD/IspF [Naasia aerilata]